MKNSFALLLALPLCGLLLGLSPVQADPEESLTPSATPTVRAPRFTQGDFGSPETTTPSGLGYRILVQGAGEEASGGHTVTVHYTGYFKDGRIFDSSVKRGDPFQFPLGAQRVIKGWDEGLVGMKKGEQRLLFIPASLAYGRRGAGRTIPPDTDLIFEVEMLDTGK